MVRFQLIQGRLGLDAPRHRKGSQQRDEHGEYENITVTAERGIPSLHYVYKSNEQQVSLSVHQAHSLRIESWLIDSDERSVLKQPLYGPIAFSIRRGELDDQHEGPTLIHVRHSDPVSFDRHYGLLIERMLHGQSLQQISSNTEGIVLSRLCSESMPALEAVREQVDKLRSPRRGIRASAERQLLSWGTPVVAALNSISQQDLDSEQQARIHAIIKRLRPRVEDTPASLAKLLAGDREYWNSIASRLDPDQFVLANRHLKQLGVEPIEIQGGPVERIAAARD
jgi:hypothetical protein